MTTIGPTFGSELEAAGLLTLPISWNENGIHGLDGLTEEESDAVSAVLAAHDPNAPEPRLIPRLAFFKQLARDGKFLDFLTWRDAQDADTIIYFLEEPAFSEEDAEVDAAMTALSLTKGTFVTSALDP